MIITEEQFNNLKQGDELNSFANDLIFEGKVGRIALFLNKTWNMVHTHPLVVLIENKYELKIPVPHLQGFPIGDYVDKKVFCAFSDEPIFDITDSRKVSISLLSEVCKDKFIDFTATKWSYARLLSDNLRLVIY